MFELVLVPNFTLKNIWIYGTNLLKKEISDLKQKSEHDQLIQHIRNGFSTKFQLTDKFDFLDQIYLKRLFFV